MPNAPRKMIDVATAPVGTALSDSEVRVLEVDLDAEWAVPALEALLSPGERNRAARFIPDDSRMRYVARNAALRVLIGAILDVPPDVIEFTEGPKGKPSVSSPTESGLEFNTANSGGRALIALTRGRRVGVDIEKTRGIAEAPRLVERFFAPSEQIEFQALPADRQGRAFFTAWARKEAFAKATGRGIGDTLARFAVTVDPDSTPKLLSVDWEADDPDGWQLVDLPVSEGFTGALAVEGQGWQLGFAQWRPALMHP